MKKTLYEKTKQSMFQNFKIFDGMQCNARVDKHSSSNILCLLLLINIVGYE